MRRSTKLQETFALLLTAGMAITLYAGFLWEVRIAGA